ncbi:FimV family protein [Methyloversatilis discipulorum]|uniref:type IV pilus assembly protein FimV n=1 Tax=Methyloversatilis discipulorum TaxID=1119528 RepID=UPI0004AD707B|nr:hypothetical protein [Methyloversatilis discipulorum]
MHTPGTAFELTRSRLRPTLLAAALLAVGLHAPHALALGLGPIKARSAIGEPFRAEISLLGSGDDVPASSCFSIDVPASAGADDLPWLTAGRIRTQGRTVFISSGTPVNEPILMVGVRIGCGHEVVREYTVLMQPITAAPDSPPAEAPVPRERARPVAVPATDAAQATAGEVEPAPAKPRAARKPRRTEATQPAGDRLFVAPGLDSGNGLKMSGGMAARPEASEAQREALRTEQKLLAALDEQIATHLAIADKVKQLEARLEALQKQLDRSSGALDIARAPAAPLAETPPPPPVTAETPVDSAAPVVEQPVDVEEEVAETPPPPPGLTNEPVKVITKLPPDTPADAEPVAPGMNWMVAGLGLLAAGAVLGGGWLWRRRAQAVAEASARRQREIEASLANTAPPRRRDQRAADTEYSQGDADAPPVFADIPAPSWSRPARADDTPPEQRTTPAMAQAVVSSIGYFPGEAPADHMEDMRIQARASDVEATPQVAEQDPLSVVDGSSVDFELAPEAATEDRKPARLDLEFDTFVGSASSAGAGDSAVAVTSGPRLVSSNTGIPPSSTLSIDQSAPPANEEAPPSHEHVLELAEIMMSFGRAEGAAQTLSEFLRDYPKESLIPWLKLLDLYHKSGRRGEYDDLAPKLNRAFNVKVPDWEHFNGPITSESVEQFAHIMARVNATWPNQDCLDYLTELLRDNRAGTRVGFPLGVIDDILLLKSMLEWLIANPPVTNTSASRLALL